MNTTTVKLKNNIEVFCKKNPNTPRIALCFNIKAKNIINNAGVESLMTRLFMQGTKTRTAEELANELDTYAIELSVDSRPDYIRFKFVCLNEDFEKSLELLSDIVSNSTFDDFDKEIKKMKGEIIAELDSPRTKVADGFYSTIFKSHRYGNTHSKILSNLPNVKKEDVKDAYRNLISSSKKVISVVGDVNFDDVENLLNKYLGNLPGSINFDPVSEINALEKSEYTEIIKPDANQAHIIKGWITESTDSPDYPVLLLLNVILGSSGLSSRLFLELRDKKGLAYVVRSCYETYAQCADFYIYIATEPKNIEVSLEGFAEEIDKICKDYVGEEELENAKNNMLGKWAFTRETNENQAILYANYGISDLGFDFNERAKAAIAKVKVEDIMRCANKYFKKQSVLSILKP